MTWLYILLWWATGFAGMLWLRRGDDITWFELLILCPLLGLLGPALVLIIALCMLAQADFWSKPVFKKHPQEDLDEGC